jgi:hypothetical protein
MVKKVFRLIASLTATPGVHGVRLGLYNVE